MSVVLKKQVKAKMDQLFDAKKDERKKKLIQDKGVYTSLSSKGIGASGAGGGGGE